MASIMTTVNIVDNMTAPLQNITNALNMTVSGLSEMESAANTAFDSATLSGIKDEINEANSGLNQMKGAFDTAKASNDKLNDTASKLPPEIDEATNSQNQLNSSISASASSFDSLLRGVGVYTLLNKAISTVTSSIDSAISRYDTLNNFPKMLELMGYSAEQAAAATQRLSDGISGLPTALNDMTGYVSQFEVITKDLNNATL
ncbi:MAG: hypothetical protein ACRDBM_00035, partial [Sporomusa sp.]